MRYVRLLGARRTTSTCSFSSEALPSSLPVKLRSPNYCKDLSFATKPQSDGTSVLPSASPDNICIVATEEVAVARCRQKGAMICYRDEIPKL